jgi:hypothetical protein
LDIYNGFQMQMTYNIIWILRRMIELNEVARWCIF